MDIVTAPLLLLPRPGALWGPALPPGPKTTFLSPKVGPEQGWLLWPNIGIIGGDLGNSHFTVFKFISLLSLGQFECPTRVKSQELRAQAPSSSGENLSSPSEDSNDLRDGAGQCDTVNFNNKFVYLVFTHSWLRPPRTLGIACDESTKGVF